MLLTTNYAIQLHDDDQPRIDPDILAESPHWPYA